MPDVSRAGSIGEVEGHQQRLGWIEPIGYDGEGVPYVLWICRHRHEIRDLREVCEGIALMRPGPWRDRLRYIDPCDLQSRAFGGEDGNRHPVTAGHESHRLDSLNESKAFPLSLIVAKRRGCEHCRPQRSARHRGRHIRRVRRVPLTAN